MRSVSRSNLTETRQSEGGRVVTQHSTSATTVVIVPTKHVADMAESEAECENTWLWKVDLKRFSHLSLLVGRELIRSLSKSVLSYHCQRPPLPWYCASPWNVPLHPCTEHGLKAAPPKCCSRLFGVVKELCAFFAGIRFPVNHPSICSKRLPRVCCSQKSLVGQ